MFVKYEEEFQIVAAFLRFVGYFILAVSVLGAAAALGYVLAPDDPLNQLVVFGSTCAVVIGMVLDAHGYPVWDKLGPKI